MEEDIQRQKFDYETTEDNIINSLKFNFCTTTIPVQVIESTKWG